MKHFFIFLILINSIICDAQYIGVRARYTATRLQDNAGFPDSRENRLVLSFYEVTPALAYIPIILTDYPLSIFLEGMQYGSNLGGVLDSTGNNYNGYAWTAPKAVAYFNSFSPNWIDCNGSLTTNYTVNGHELDCGFIRVSHWEDDPDNPGVQREIFTAPNVCLPYYMFGHPLAFSPGNVNFSWPVPPTAPYNWYSFFCGGNTPVVIRGVLEAETGPTSTLPVKFSNVYGEVDGNCRPVLKWSNSTESNIDQYIVQRSSDGVVFQNMATVFPLFNTGGQADYSFTDVIAPAGLNMYRIMAVELSADHFYSTTLRIHSCVQMPVPKLFIYPNPASQGRFVLKVDDLPAGKYEVLLVNTIGQRRRLQRFEHLGGALNKIYQPYYTGPGQYTLVLCTSGMQLTHPLVILD